uniref:Uncharacterized protein n=1 Tax=Plectus sambesii TaxID=2011161 RepID=A0A914WEM0_9BILA
MSGKLRGGSVWRQLDAGRRSSKRYERPPRVWLSSSRTVIHLSGTRFERRSTRTALNSNGAENIAVKWRVFGRLGVRDRRRTAVAACSCSLHPGFRRSGRFSDAPVCADAAGVGQKTRLGVVARTLWERERKTPAPVERRRL